VTAFLRLTTACIVGIMLNEARHATEAAEPEAGLVLTAVALFVATSTLLATLAETAAARRAHRVARAWERRARRADQRAVDAEAAAVALRRSRDAWLRRSRHWQARYELAEAEVSHVMLHTPMGGTLAEIHGQPDTGDRAS